MRRAGLSASAKLLVVLAGLYNGKNSAEMSIYCGTWFLTVAVPWPKHEQ